MPELNAELLFTIRIRVDTLYDIGATPIGTVHMDQLGGGSFEGPRLRGEVLPGGMDQKIMRADGSFQPNVRLILRTDDEEGAQAEA
jgi:hypothetical protein